jgi:hypothetical protein
MMSLALAINISDRIGRAKMLRGVPKKAASSWNAVEHSIEANQIIRMSKSSTN